MKPNLEMSVEFQISLAHQRSSQNVIVGIDGYPPLAYLHCLPNPDLGADAIKVRGWLP